jgi:PAS domain S-box-containing protein
VRQRGKAGTQPGRSVPDESLRSILAAIIDSSDDAIVAKNLDGIILSWNRGAEAIFGFTAAEAVGQPITIIIPEDRLHEEIDVLARIRSGNKIDHFETVRRTKNGQLINVSITVSPIRNKSGTIVGASKVARDITDRKRLDEERHRWLEREQQARRQAERALQVRDEFLATVSHELRSPLNAIVGWAHLLETGNMDSDGVRRAGQTISRNAASQSQLICDILDAQSLTSGKLRLDIGEVDVPLIVEASVDTVRPAAAAKGIKITSAVSSSLSSIEGDPGRLQQIIWNLLSNAVKFTQSGGSVRLVAQDRDQQVEITVEDDGPGIRPDFLPYVFDSFRQDKPPGFRLGGVGLGLSIVRQLAELHGGGVSARNREDGRGAIFTVSLPKRSRHPAAVRRIGADAGHQEGAPSLHGTRVLVVDDELDAREVVAAVLAACGADVTVVASGEVALTLFCRVRPDVIVSDLSMPGLSGCDFVRAIRALSEAEGGSTPAIALTGATTKEDRLQATQAGYAYFLGKPVRPIELATAVATVAGENPGP